MHGVLHLRDRLSGERGLVQHGRAPEQEAVAGHDVVVLAAGEGEQVARYQLRRLGRLPAARSATMAAHVSTSRTLLLSCRMKRVVPLQGRRCEQRTFLRGRPARRSHGCPCPVQRRRAAHRWSQGVHVVCADIDATATHEQGGYVVCADTGCPLSSHLERVEVLDALEDDRGLEGEDHEQREHRVLADIQPPTQIDAGRRCVSKGRWRSWVRFRASARQAAMPPSARAVLMTGGPLRPQRSPASRSRGTRG